MSTRNIKDAKDLTTNDSETGWLLISGNDFIPKPNHFYAIEIKKERT